MTKCLHQQHGTVSVDNNEIIAYKRLNTKQAKNKWVKQFCAPCVLRITHFVYKDEHEKSVLTDEEKKRFAKKKRGRPLKKKWTNDSFAPQHKDRQNVV